MHGGPPAKAHVSAADPESYFEEAPMSTSSPAPLSYDVIVSEGPTGAGGELMPDGTPQKWSPLSSALIFGFAEGLLVDPPFTLTQSPRSPPGSPPAVRRAQRRDGARLREKGLKGAASSCSTGSSRARSRS